MLAAQTNPRDHVIERIYSAAGGVNSWGDALERLSEFCGAQASYIDLLSETDRAPSLVGAFGHAAPLIERYHTYGHLIDPTTSQILASPGEPVSFNGLMRREIGGPAFHREFIAPRGTEQVLAIGLTTEVGTLLVKLSSDARGLPFTRDSEARLESLAHHLRQAVVMDRSVRRRMEADAFASEIVERLRAAVLRLDDRLAVSFANRAAIRMAGEGDVIAIANGRLRLVDGDAMEAFRTFLRRTTMAGRSVSGTTLLQGDRGRRVRAWAWSTGSRNRPDIGLMIFPHDYEPDVLEAMLRENYGLTPSEIRTTLGVLSHNGLAAVAEHTGVSLETVRFHMKRIFSKTGTCRQSELVRVIANDFSCIDVGESPAGSGRRA